MTHAQPTRVLLDGCPACLRRDSVPRAVADHPAGGWIAFYHCREVVVERLMIDGETFDNPRTCNTYWYTSWGS